MTAQVVQHSFHKFIGGMVRKAVPDNCKLLLGGLVDEPGQDLLGGLFLSPGDPIQAVISLEIQYINAFAIRAEGGLFTIHKY